MDRDEITNRELLIRIDERQQHMYAEMQKYNQITDRLVEKCNTLERNTISKGSVTYLLSLIGGFASFCFSVYLIFTNKTQP